MALDDIYDIQHTMTLFNVSIRNSYQALRANAGENAATISDGFQNSVLPSIRAWQSDQLVNNDLIIKNLGDPLDFGTFSLSAATGNRALVDLATFVAGEVRFPRLRSDMRNGYKRFAGAGETDVGDQDFTAAALTLLNAIGTALVGNWLSSVDSHHIANFIIVKRVCDATDPETGKCIKYRLPKDAEVPVYYQPTQGIAYTKIRSQVSRRAPTV